jgi:hypothetical protein
VATISLAQIKLRYVIEGRPLEGATEVALSTDPRGRREGHPQCHCEAPL